MLTAGTDHRGAGIGERVRRRGGSLRGRAAILPGVLALTLVLAGCGGASTVTTARSAPAAIQLTSPVLGGSGTSGKLHTIPVRYTCDGGDTIPPVNWGAVPSDTSELALLLFDVGRTAPAANGAAAAELGLQWAVVGLSPTIHAIAAGRLPRGAIAGPQPYSICPAKGKAVTYIFQLYALSHGLSVKPHATFNAAGLIREIRSSTLASGYIASRYKRA